MPPELVVVACVLGVPAVCIRCASCAIAVAAAGCNDVDVGILLPVTSAIWKLYLGRHPPPNTPSDLDHPPRLSAQGDKLPIRFVKHHILLCAILGRFLSHTASREYMTTHNTQCSDSMRQIGETTAQQPWMVNDDGDDIPVAFRAGNRWKLLYTMDPLNVATAPHPVLDCFNNASAIYDRRNWNDRSCRRLVLIPIHGQADSYFNEVIQF